MSIRIQILYNGKNISLSHAINMGYVNINGDQIEPAPNKDVQICISSRLFDLNGQELFEKDVVQAQDGKQYRIIYDFGVFYLTDRDKIEKIPLYIYKLKNSVNVEKCKNSNI